MISHTLTMSKGPDKQSQIGTHGVIFFVTFHVIGCLPLLHQNHPRVFSTNVKEAVTFVMIRGSRCSTPPLSVKPQGAFPWSSTSTSSSSCKPAVLLHPSTSLHHFILSAGSLRWSLGSTESMTLAIQPLTLV